MRKMRKTVRRILLFIVFISILYIGVYVCARMTPKLSINTSSSYFLYDKDNDLFENNGNNEWVKLNDISPHLINATLAIEDKNFYKHQGFDYLRILKAIYTNLTHGKIVQGASTITQQYAKNLYLTFDQTLKRKIDEAWLTLRLETHYSKDEILEGYLNTINYGGVFGIENASQYYFGKKAKDLTLAEAAILAGIPKDPTYYSPTSNYNNAKKRQKLILSVMKENKYIDETEMKNAVNAKLTFKTEEEDDSSKMLMYYEDAVLDELKSIKTIPTSFLETGGLKIYTNLDHEAQKSMEDSIDKNFKDNEELQVAAVMMNPNNGKVFALTGGRDYSKSQYNRAISAKRQVGSTMKPFLYYAALENGFTESTTFTSEKTTFMFSENKTYSPTNYGEKYANKPISMATAVAYSDNIYAVKTHLFLGENVLSDMTKRVGITTSLDEVPSSPLGTKELNIMEMMTGYAAFANEGYKVEPYLIRKVTDIEGNVLYEHKEDKGNVLNKSLVYILNEMLNNSYSKEFIDYNYPTCISLAPRLSKKYAIKTGTTNTDHLIFGYNKDVLMGIWSGYDDNSDTEVDDGTNMKYAWADSVEAYLKEKNTKWYEMPDNVVGMMVDPISGTPATDETKNKKMFYYIKGTEPTSETKDLDVLVPTIKTE